ncbi:MAG: orotidine-5'-phosphate decarboxylase, partial [Nitrospinae bacterium]|nr:orotidine-5'-phosphate decarboxylase [Nitrospinota bacterium]
MVLSAKERIIFPLDCSTLKEAEYYVAILKDYVGLFKIGLELFVSVGPEAIRRIKAISGVDQGNIFLDMKFHDIPETVRSAYQAASIHGVSFVTIHCDEGRRLIETMVGEVIKGSRTRVLAVTLLTSIDKNSLIMLGYPPDITPKEIVLLKAELAKEAGCDGVVCSGLEAHLVKERFGPDFIVVVPGIRPLWSKVRDDDQRRIVTPSEAVRKGADYVVVGRPIREASDPVTAAIKIAEEIEDALLAEGLS